MHSNPSGLREAVRTFQQAQEGEMIRVHLVKSHPIVKIRFGSAIIEGEYVSFKHGVLRILDGRRKPQMVPSSVIIGAEQFEVEPLPTVQ